MSPVTGKPLYLLLVKEKTWKHIFNTKSELPQNRTEKQIMPSKTTINWLFNEIWCYLIIACFEWKIDVFQQTVVRGYFLLKKLVIERVYSVLGSLTISIFSITIFNNSFVFLLFFICCLETRQQNLGHCWGKTYNQPVLVTLCFFILNEMSP